MWMACVLVFLIEHSQPLPPVHPQLWPMFQASLLAFFLWLWLSHHTEGPKLPATPPLHSQILYLGLTNWRTEFSDTSCLTGSTCPFVQIPRVMFWSFRTGSGPLWDRAFQQWTWSLLAVSQDPSTSPTLDNGSSVRSGAFLLIMNWEIKICPSLTL